MLYSCDLTGSLIMMLDIAQLYKIKVKVAYCYSSIKNEDHI